MSLTLSNFTKDSNRLNYGKDGYSPKQTMDRFGPKYTGNTNVTLGGNNYYGGQLAPTRITSIGAVEPLQYSYPPNSRFYDVPEGTQVIYYPDSKQIHIGDEFTYLQLPFMTDVVTLSPVKQVNERVTFTTPCMFTCAGVKFFAGTPDSTA